MRLLSLFLCLSLVALIASPVEAARRTRRATRNRTVRAIRTFRRVTPTIIVTPGFRSRFARVGFVGNNFRFARRNAFLFRGRFFPAGSYAWSNGSFYRSGFNGAFAGYGYTCGAGGSVTIINQAPPVVVGGAGLTGGAVPGGVIPGGVIPGGAAPGAPSSEFPGALPGLSAADIADLKTLLAQLRSAPPGGTGGAPAGTGEPGKVVPVMPPAGK